MSDGMDFLASEEKNWNKEFEKKVRKLTEPKFSFSQGSKKPFFGIDTPPPYASGRPWHLGAAAQYSQIDMTARTARMLGNEVLFPVGIDRNGLPVEIYTEKKHKIRMRDTDREKFIRLCKSALDELEKEMVEILKELGFSADFDALYRTDSDDYRTLTQATFIDAWKKGRIYVGKRPSNYCTDCGTTIADAEIEYKDIPTKLVHFRFKLPEDGELTVASTRPELLGACKALIVNPTDERYKNLIGKTALTPIYGDRVPIIGNASAKPEFGSGVVMVCSYGDYDDVLLFRELALKEKIIVDETGHMTKDAGVKLNGLDVKAARKSIVEELDKLGLVEKIEEISHRTPICERSKTPIELLSMEEYYMKVTDIKKGIGKAADELKFTPIHNKQILVNWLDVAADWPISRRRYYGTEIPVWYCKKCGEAFIPEAGRYYQPWREAPPKSARCKCGSTEFKGDDRTFDTWFDSSITALYATKFSVDNKFFSKTYPLTIRQQGIDIIRTWLFYSILRCTEITGKLPWSTVWIGGMGLDEHGEKMSKSKGNVVDPTPIMEEYGTDAFRFWNASEASVGSNFLFSEVKLNGAKKFMNKFWNIAKLIRVLKPEAQSMDLDKLYPTDKWILGELSILIDDCLNGYKEFNFFIPSNKIREFVWNVFAPHYLEMVKARAYGGEKFSKDETESARYAMYECMRVITLLLAPVSPFISDAVWHSLYGKDSVHRMAFPGIRYAKDLTKYGTEILDFNGTVWNEKRSKGLSLRDSIEIDVPENLSPFKKDLSSMHNIR